jgi:polygalacturonase
VDGVRIHSLGSGRRVPNDDGIDLWDCRNVRIRGCEIETGDDCIALFTAEEAVVTGCTLSSRSAGIRVGYCGGPIRNCLFRACPDRV